MRRLEDDIGGPVADLGRGTTHHTSQRDCPRVVGDYQVVRVKQSLGPVEGGEAFPGLRPANADCARELRAVEGVQRLTGFEHDVVSHVHRE